MSARASGGGGVSGCDTINGGPGGGWKRAEGDSLSLFKGRINKEMSL